MIFRTDFRKNSIDLSELVNGGPGKDGIPALFNPSFQIIENTFISENVDGVLVSVRGVKKFYPYNILVWHEIVNDRIADLDIAVTFCPLCGSAVVYNRNFKGRILDFKVSGLLYDSNMVMYDTETESFWLQSTGSSLAGKYNRKRLERVHFTQMTVAEVKSKYPDAYIMETSTGYTRDYTFYPYIGYDNSDFLYFPVDDYDEKYHPKELFYIIPVNDQSVALRISSIKKSGHAAFRQGGINLTASYIGGELVVLDDENRKIPGYYEMWFSWAIRHVDDGILWEPLKLK